MRDKVTKVTVSTAAGAVTYEDVARVKTSGDGALVVIVLDDEKLAREVWFGPGFWHTMTADTQKYND